MRLCAINIVEAPLRSPFSSRCTVYSTSQCLFLGWGGGEGGEGWLVVCLFCFVFFFS